MREPRGTTATETSAYHGLNSFAAEFGAVLVFPGGKGFITRRPMIVTRPGQLAAAHDAVDAVTKYLG